MRRFGRWLGFGFCAFVLLLPKHGSAQAPYYKGKTIAVIEGRSPGGVGDLRTKSILPFLQKYIPGNPTVVPEYMPGGGGRQAANYVYRAKAEGLTIGASSPGILASAILGETGVEYDPYKFMYLGSPFSENNNMFATRKALGINNLEKLRGAAGPRIGAQSVGHVQYIRGRFFAWLLGLKDPKFVVGYAGTELDVALERGEIDARAVAVDTVSMSEAYKKLVDFHAILEIPKGHRPSQFADLPEIEAFVRSDIEKRVMVMSRVFWGDRNAGLSAPEHTGEPRRDTQTSLSQFLRRSPISRTIQKTYWTSSDAAHAGRPAETSRGAAAGYRGRQSF